MLIDYRAVRRQVPNGARAGTDRLSRDIVPWQTASWRLPIPSHEAVTRPLLLRRYCEGTLSVLPLWGPRQSTRPLGTTPPPTLVQRRSRPLSTRRCRHSARQFTFRCPIAGSLWPAKLAPFKPATDNHPSCDLKHLKFRCFQDRAGDPNRHSDEKKHGDGRQRSFGTCDNVQAAPYA
jgi:hypothetical protein